MLSQLTVSSDKKEELMKKERKHRILDKPILACILLIIWGLFLYQLFPGCFMNIVNNDVIMDIIMLILAVLGFLIHRFWFRGEYKGSISNRWLQDKDVCIGLILVVVVDLIIMFKGLISAGVAFTVTAVLGALVAGVGEEMTVRALPISVMMRDWMDEKHIVFTAFFTSILFGLIHLLNMVVGASLNITLLQVGFAFALGVFFAAVYLRTANILITVIFHSLHDVLGMIMVGNTDKSGIMKGSSFSFLDILPTLIFSILCLVVGIYLIRKSVRPQIVEVWKERWNRED